MARVEVPLIVLSDTGAPVNGASVAIVHRSSGNPATWWNTETGGTSSTSPVITDSRGRVNAWVDPGQYSANITGTGITSYSEPFEAVSAAPGAVGVSALAAAVLELIVPIGGIIGYSGNSDPSGGRWMIADGRAVSRTTYSTLFGLHGTAYGAGDGSSTFNLPDLRGRSMVGLGTNTAVDTRGKSDGLAVGSRSPVHAHGDGTLAVASHTHGDGTLAAAAHAHFVGFSTGVNSAFHTFYPASSGALQITVAAHTHTHATGLQATESSGADVTGSTGASAPDVTGATANASGGYMVTNHLIRVL